MNRREFMEQLEQLLAGIPIDEREEALKYYSDYFDDAGVENESEVIRELGTPGQVAGIIKAGLEGQDEETGEFTETGYQATGNRFPGTSPILKVILVVLIFVCAIPIGGPILLALFCVVVGLICAAFGVFAVLVVGSAALMLGGAAIFVLGLTKLLAALPVALLTSGSGLIIFVLGLIATVVTVKLCIVVCPAIFRFFVEICRKPFHRKAVS